MDLVILAGGKGTRIKQLNPHLPKPMIKFNKISFLQLIINYYAKFDFDNIYIIAGYKGLLIKKKFHNKTQNFVKIKCFVEKKPLDTGGAINLVKQKIEKDFILINGDTLVDIKNPKVLINDSKKIVGTMGLIKSSKKNVKFNNLFLNKEKIVIRKRTDFINAGIYYFNKKIFKFLKNKPQSMENEILPKLLKQKKIKGAFLKGFFIDIGTPSDLKKAKKILPKLLSKPSIFLDRDGVINHDDGYTFKFKNFRFRKNVIKFLKKLNDLNYNIFIVTNQAGIAKKKFTLKNFILLHKQIKKYLSRKNIFINDVEYCPHHPLAKLVKYRMRCSCRKPSNQMIKNIEKRWYINKSKSLFIGDQIKDKLTAQKSNIKFYFVKKDILKQFRSIKYFY